MMIERLRKQALLKRPMSLFLSILKTLKFVCRTLAISIPCFGVLLLLAKAAKAQSLGDPVVNITFGAGTASHAGALTAGTTNYTYSSADFPIDGSYTIENTTNTPGTWWTTTDHTGDTGGYMMVVNASAAKTDYFYKKTVSGLCGGTTYQFGAWIMNLLRSQDNSPPNITFSVTTVSGTVLGSYNTGQIPITSTSGKGIWKSFTFNFTTTSSEDVVIQMTNNANGGAPANDLALDDITFRAYGSQVVASLGSSSSATSATTCAGSTQAITINSQSTLASGFVQKPQIYTTANGWVDIGSASTATSFPISIPSPAGTYLYRLVSASSDNISSSSCYVASNALTLNVTAGPSADFGYTASNCLNDVVMFTDKPKANGSTITSSVWDFGDGSATSSTPSHVYATPGTYTVTLTVTSSTGCTSTASHAITINTKPVAAFTISSPNCAGQPVIFTDNSTSVDGAIAQWIWDYSDGTTETLTTGGTHTHTYISGGNYNATLTVILAAGCSSAATTKSVSVTSLPSVVTTFTSNTTANEAGCTNNAKTLTVTAAATPTFISPVYQWQLSTDGGTTYTNITGATTADYSFTTSISAGTYLYRVVASDAGYSANCSVTSSTSSLVVTAPPTASFTYAAATCLKDAVLFTDNSTSASIITAWMWDFGDGQTSVLQNPSHVYSVAGNYLVKLTVVNSAGCSMSSETQAVHINADPVAAYTFTTPDCATQAVTFTDASTTTDGTLVRWIWNYGDGKADTLSSAAPHSHVYTTSGTFNSSLMVFTAAGCQSTFVIKPVTVNAIATVDFTIPDVCLNDAYAQFTDASTISDGSQAGFKYLWNFGDTNATSGNPNTSTQQNPRHKYTKAQLYNVTLTVTTANGCVTTKTQQLSVNGENPVANFAAASTQVCSDAPALFTDNSYVADFGNVTKIQWYFDFDNQPAAVEEYNDPVKGTTYPHNYPVITYPAAPKKYHVVLKAYSGGTCVNITDGYVTLLPIPIIKFDAITPVCINAGTVQLAGKETSGLGGTTSYFGKGVTSDGIFDPLAAGIGTTNITYTFTSTAGCSESFVQQITVNPVPTATITDKVTILDGGSITLDASIAGDTTGLVYRWSPSAGLDNDAILNPVASPTDDTQYTLTVTTKAGCNITATTFIKVLKAPVVPNTFTPNGDGVNDVWNIEYLSSYPNSQISVFNRYGNKVFTSVGYPVPWDGTMAGANLPTGVYYYIIDPRRSGRKAVSGYVTILR
ncbi:PKD domain-containing protein [Mucilaginibacter ginkgonis]|uniref:PKD domain-containing protein n=1 Tax=Mucilaginibacter ginkgonis TaxID=2682091 RepID=A0A7T7FBC2_9SPHI|nr:PKD domain-containing protein [Mucilaginibacter ginkgonis]QQL50238.1 PKD domain-containing protein [Mucilaginibacter ginkgonis]